LRSFLPARVARVDNAYAWKTLGIQGSEAQLAISCLNQ
jgi:hypothetical protein